jgi:hypothetical protein
MWNNPWQWQINLTILYRRLAPGSSDRKKRTKSPYLELGLPP